RPVIVVHGGAWAVPDALAEVSVAGVKAATRAGNVTLMRGGGALDAVEVAVRTMEDDPAFDAGHGAVLNTDGEVELDALIMEGRTLATGAVSSVRNIANPVSLARAVMEKVHSPPPPPPPPLPFPHAPLFCAACLYRLFTCERVKTSSAHLASPRAESVTLPKLHRDRGSCPEGGAMAGCNPTPVGSWAHDTVGAVALDSCGNVASATSTGGIRYKMVGRVGDSPVIGSGGYADNRSGAVSCTGHGESILKVTLARLILSHMDRGKAACEAVERSLRYMGERVQGGGGAVAVAPTGDWTACFTTERMAWAAIHGGILHY
ncbi:hypothetical protein P4O66_013842, partial [Electrophorus voltai]